ncbi:MAG: sortase [Aeromicrobium erythreum]
MSIMSWASRGPGRRRDRSLVAVAQATDELPERSVLLSSALAVVSVITIWFLAQMLVLGGLEHERSQDRLYGDFRAELADGTAPTGGVVAPGRPVALMSVPSLGIQEVVVEGTSSGHLLGGPGHRRDTVLPGQAGVSVLYGRSTTFGRPFDAMLHDAVGRHLQVVTGQGRSTYRIERIRRPGDPVAAPPAEGQGRMTLVTSEGSGPLAALRPGRVVYVEASLQSKAFAPGGQRVNTIASSERPMAGDASVLPMLALTLGGLLVAVVGVVLARRRFGPLVTWTLAVPVVAALGWFAGDLALHLFPNVV